MGLGDSSVGKVLGTHALESSISSTHIKSPLSGDGHPPVTPGAGRGMGGVGGRQNPQGQPARQTS